MLAIIGPDGLDVRSEDGRRRLDNPKDWVRLEIERAFARGITVVPIQVAGATLPGRNALPQKIQPLVDRQAVTITTNGFRSEMAGLVRDIRATRDEPRKRVVAVTLALGTRPLFFGY